MDKNCNFSLQCFHKTLGTRRRQWPPSKQEILCTINRRPIYARFHFMDGQFHAIEFDPSATADEVLKLVRSKIGLRDNAQGKIANFTSSPPPRKKVKKSYPERESFLRGPRPLSFCQPFSYFPPVQAPRAVYTFEADTFSGA